jgi:predicted DNA binding protein
MRKAVIDMEYNKMLKGFMGDIFQKVDHIEGREILQMDFEKGMKLVIVDIFMKEGYGLKDFSFPKSVEILNVLQTSGNRHTILMKAKAPGKMMAGLMKLFDLDLIYDMPYFADNDHFILSCIGENEAIQKLLKMLNFLGEVKKVSFSKATFSEYNILNVLTEKQKEIMIEAKKLGYYNYPRKMNANELSERLGISKATTVEHLRKAEIRLISNLLAAY